MRITDAIHRRRQAEIRGTRQAAGRIPKLARLRAKVLVRRQIRELLGQILDDEVRRVCIARPELAKYRLEPWLRRALLKEVRRELEKETRDGSTPRP